MKAILLQLISAAFVTVCSYGQSSKKENIRLYQKIQRLDTTSIQKGNHLDLAKQMDVSAFIQYYLTFGKVHNSKEYGRTHISELFKDSSFTYFARQYSHGLLDFIKTPTTDLNTINYRELDGNLLRNRFLDEIVPETDKQQVLKREKDCTAGNNYYDFKYEYRPNTKEIEIKYKWKVSCDFVIKIINKTYNATYDINKAEFRNTRN